MQIYQNILVRVDREDLEPDGSFVVPDDVKEIECSAFMFCNKDLKNITMPEGVESIEAFTFYGCENLNQVQLPKTIKHIGDLAFFDCFNLTSMEIQDGANILGKGLFTSCVNLETVIIPNSVKSIGSEMFYGCENLKQLAIPKRFEELIDEILSDYFRDRQKPDIVYLQEPQLKAKQVGDE